MSIIGTAIFVKNVPAWERAVRFGLGIGLLAAAFTVVPPGFSWVVAAAGIGAGLTGIFGVCPMCALAGRRLREKV
jgi:hypothetical protein